MLPRLFVYAERRFVGVEQERDTFALKPTTPKKSGSTTVETEVITKGHLRRLFETFSTLSTDHSVSTYVGDVRSRPFEVVVVTGSKRTSHKEKRTQRTRTS